MDPDSELADLPGGERCDFCGRGDTDEHWLWFEVERLGDDDCEFDSVDLVFCSQAHAAEFLAGSEIDWEPLPDDRRARAAGTRVDQFFLGCGLLAIVLSVIGVVALVRWVF